MIKNRPCFDRLSTNGFLTFTKSVSSPFALSLSNGHHEQPNENLGLILFAKHQLARNLRDMPPLEARDAEFVGCRLVFAIAAGDGAGPHQPVSPRRLGLLNDTAVTPSLP